MTKPSQNTSSKAPAGVSVPRSQASGEQSKISTVKGVTSPGSPSPAVKQNEPAPKPQTAAPVTPPSSQTVAKPAVPNGTSKQPSVQSPKSTTAPVANALNFSTKPVPERPSVPKTPSASPFGSPPFIPSSPTASNDIRVERAVTFWVLDGDGNWKIPLPNWTIEDILGSIDTRKDEDRELPYTIQSVNVDGRVEGNIAKLKVEFRISTTTSAVVRVPLGLKEGVCILDEGKHDIYDAIGYVGLGNYSIEYDDQANGYVALIQNRPVSAWANKTSLKSSRKDESASGSTAGSSSHQSKTETKSSESETSGLDSEHNLLGNRNGFGRLRSGFSLHTLTMTLCFPVRSQGKEEYSLAATFPPTVHAKLRLVVPQPDVQIRVNQGVIGLPPTNLNETTSEIVLSGLNRNWEASELVWFKKDRPITDERAILQIEDAEINALPGVQDIQYSVKLPIRTYGGDSDTFRIRLPKYARLVRDSVVATGLNNSVLEIQDIKEIKPTEVAPVAEKTTDAPAKPVATPVKSDATAAKPAVNTTAKPTAVKPDAAKPDATAAKPVATSVAAKPVAPVAAKPVITATDTSGPVVEITLSRKVRDTVVFQFKAVAENTQAEQAAIKNQTASQDWELGGFEVLGAQKQHGRVKIQFPEGLNFKVTPSYGVRPILEESQDADEQTEQYRFFTQPFSLKAQVIVRQTRIKVKPEYQISVQQGQIELRALFQYSVHGSKVKQLSFRFGDWIINEVKSNYIVDVDKIYTEPVSKEVVLPLTAGSEGFIEVELVAVRDLNRKGDLLEFQLPLPIADWIDPAAVVIVPDDNIELIPMTERMQMLRPRSRRSFSLYFEIPSRQQPPLMFQAESCDSRKKTAQGQRVDHPVFASTIKFHTRKVQVQSQTDVLLQGREGEQIQQTLLYNVAYEPLEAVTFLVPRELQDPAAVKITVQGKPISPQKIV
ncbi:MAG: hypothetical protein Q4G59_05880, partial [Planctomycetia bacterium]|nr:hypothetical protein [Planctomycetia bacterium]